MYDLAALESALAETIFAGKLHFSADHRTRPTTTPWRLRATARRKAQSTLPMSSGQGGDGAIMPGTLRPAKGFTSASFCARRFPPHVCRFCRLPQGLPRPTQFSDASGLVVDLRWPNDLLIGPRKTGGILVEAHTEGSAALSLQWWGLASTCISAALIRA